MKSTIFALMVVGAAASAFGDAAYFGYSEMIRMSDVVAVIDVTEITPTETKGTFWTYRQKISAKVIEVFKGSVERTLTIYGLEDFICAQCRFQKGKQLVFLKHDRDFLVGSNWHLSIRPIAGEHCEWFQDSASIQLVPASLPTVIKQVKAEIEKQKGIGPGGLTRFYRIDPDAFVGNLKRSVSAESGESNQDLLVRFFKENHIQLKKPSAVVLDETRRVLTITATEADQDRMELLLVQKKILNRR